MQFPVDLHTHTVASYHAYSTIVEYVHQAKLCGIKMFATTDHGPSLEDAPHVWHFGNLKVVPRICEGIAVLRGIEANIMPGGTIDIDKYYRDRLDIVLAGFHPNNPPTNPEEHLKNYISVMEKGLVDVISHPGNASYPCDYEELLVAAKKYNVAVEINSSSDVNTRKGSHENCIKIAHLAKKIGNTVSLGTDSHICYYLGNFESVMEILKVAEIGEDQIINTSPLKVLDFLESRGKEPIAQMRSFFEKA